jgi:hypothetical protein
MRVALVDVDSAIPNLALMRLSAWHKARGDEVVLLHYAPFGRSQSIFVDQSDRAYVSCVFSWNADLARRIHRCYTELFGVPTELGGSGVDWGREPGTWSRLPPEVEATPPDYDLYGDDRAIGFCQRGCIRKCDFCLTPDSPVLTAAGPRAISMIAVGDRVVTHTGAVRRVTAVMRRPYAGPVVRVFGPAASRWPGLVVTMTPEHPVLVRHMSHPTGPAKLRGVSWKPVGEALPYHPHRACDYLRLPRITENGAAIGEDLAEFLGWYLAEGYINRTEKRGDYAVTLTFGKSEREEGFARRAAARAESWGRHAYVHRVPGAWRTMVNSVRLARWVRREFGGYSHEKRMPEWTRRLPVNEARAMLDAWLLGDGSSDGNLRRGSSVSRDLAFGMRDLALKIGWSARIGVAPGQPGEIDGRPLRSTLPVWEVGTYDRPLNQKTARDAIHYRLLREPAEYSGDVWNLSVEEDESYCTPFFAVHNCLVSAKEGTMDRYPFSHPSEWVPDRLSKVLLLDNEFAAQPAERQRSVASWVRDTGRRWSITQGYDLRILARRPELAGVLADARPMDLKFKGVCLYTAWDYLGIEPAVRKGIAALYDAGFRGRDLCVYILCGHRDSHEDDLHRFRVLWEELGAYPYVMKYNKRTDDPWLNAFARYVNRRVFKSCAWEDYDRAAHDRARRAAEASP